MVALAANFPRPSRKLGVTRVIPLNAGSRVFQGSLVMLDADGYGRPAAALANNTGCIGVSTEDVTNSGADGAASVVVQEGEFLFTGTTLAQTVLGAVCYGEDDNTVDESQSANEPVAGIVAEFVSATSAWVQVGMGSRAL